MVWLKRVLELTPLERRIAPSAYVVTNLADSGLGSFRQAVINANNGPGEDTIQFDSVLFATYPGPITLTTGQITVSDSLNISGPGNQRALISGNNASRIINSSATLSISDLSFESGSSPGAPSPGNGGVVYTSAALSLSHRILSGTATNGGSIFQLGSTLTAYNCTFSGAGATLGGAIYATGNVSIQYSRFDSVGSSSSSSAGGAVYLASGSLNIDSSSFAGCGSLNLNFGKGGAVYANGTFFAQNSTFATNYGNQGAALYLTSGGTLWNCTVANNTAGSGKGGGIYGDVTLESTIVSNNGAGTGPDIFGAVTAKNCALGTSSGFTSFTDQSGNLAFGQDLKMEYGSLYHGGLVPVTSLHYSSPCKDKGSNPAAVMNDARGPGLPRTVGTAPDIGAFEIQPPPRLTLQINDGSAQRSRITSVAITFDQSDISTTSGIKNATQLKRVSDNAVVTLSLAGGVGPPDTLTTKTYSFTFTAGPVESNSLADGVYQLNITANQLTDPSGQFLDGNGDGIGGDDYVSPTTVGNPNRIFRLFGDGAVSGSDFNLFRTAFGGSSAMFDFDNDGSVSANDFTQFKERFGASI